ncbi:MAG: ATP-binding cassette domain-containing protein [Myxococcales bacterium]
MVRQGGALLLRGVSVAATAGEVLGVLGPSGAGKTTLFRALCGELEVAAGTVCLDGADITSWPLWKRARAGLGYVPQSPSVFWDLTVRQNLETYGRVALGRVGDIEANAARVGLSDRLEVRGSELSAGERRRLEFARSVTRLPRVLVCDEPFAGVDPKGAERLGELLRGLALQGVAVLLADHHVSEALAVCTRALLLVDGQVVVEAEPAEFREHPVVRARYLIEGLGRH